MPTISPAHAKQNGFRFLCRRRRKCGCLILFTNFLHIFQVGGRLANTEAVYSSRLSSRGGKIAMCIPSLAITYQPDAKVYFSVRKKW